MSNRRQFLKKMGVVGGGGLASALLADIVVWDRIFQTQAMALEVDVNMNYVNINMGGGPPRYMADHWLKVAASDPNPVVSTYSSTAYTANSSGQVTGQEYRTHVMGNYVVPHLYSTLPGNSGASLLNQTLIMQGYGSGIDGHGFNTSLQFFPLASAASFTGCIADISRRPFEAARHPDIRAGKFVSKQNVGLNQLNASRPLNTLLGTLAASNKTRTLATSATLKDYFDDARGLLASVSTDSVNLKAAQANLSRGYSLLNSTLGDFEAEWDALITKYTTVVNDAMRDDFVPGLTATLDGTKQLYLETNDTDGRFNTGTNEGYLKVGSNLIQLCEQANNESFAIGLALAEFVFKYELVSAVEINGGTLSNLLLAPGISSNSFFDLGNDMHGGGGYVANLAMSMYHRGIWAGLAELRSALMRLGIWERSHLHLTSEFDRKISLKATGSGHGTEQMVSSLISGKISGGPYVVGNIYNLEPGANSETVSQAYAAPISGYASERPSPTTMCSTMSSVVFPDLNPWKNVAPPLVSLNKDGTLLLPYGRGKVIA